MYSLNAPVPSRVARLASDLARDLPSARARTRDEHSLLVKRLGTGTEADPGRLAAMAREALAGAAAFDVAVTGVDFFESPPAGTGPVVYLAVESPELVALHRHLCETFEPVSHLEGDSYVPHVTIARGGTVAAAERLAARDIDRVTTAVDELVVWDARHSLPTTRIGLSA